MTAGGTDRLLMTLQATRARLTTALREVERRSPDARVLAVGYPQIVRAGSPCPELPLAAGDYDYAERVNRALTDAVRTLLLDDARRSRMSAEVARWVPQFHWDEAVERWEQVLSDEARR